MSGKDGHGVQSLSCKEQTRLGHLHTAVVAVLAAVEEHSEVQGSGEEVSDVRLCHRIRGEEEHLVGVLDVRDSLRCELSGGPDTRPHDHETSSSLADSFAGEKICMCEFKQIIKYRNCRRAEIYTLRGYSIT